MTIRIFLSLCGEKAEKVMLYECDEREGIIVSVETLLGDERYADALDSDVGAWDYEDDGILCIYYFRN